MRRKNQGDKFTKLLRRLIIQYGRMQSVAYKEGRPMEGLILSVRKSEIILVLDIYEEFKGWK